MSLVNRFRRANVLPPSPLVQRQPTPPPATPDDSAQPRTSIRRPRSDSLEQENRPESTAFSPEAIKRHKRVARQVCQGHKLTPNALDAVAGAPDMPSMILMMYGALLAQQNQGRTAELAALLQQKDWRAALQVRLTGVLLSPHLTAYLDGIHPQIMDMINRDPGKFGVPQDLLAHSDLLSKLASTVTSLLSRARGNIKQKLFASLGSLPTGKEAARRSLNICELAKSLVPRNFVFEVRTVHQFRYAFLRACANAWIKNLPKGQQLAYPTLPHNPTPTSCEGTHADANPDADADADGYGDVNDDGNDDGDDVGNGDGDGDGVRDSDGKHNGSQSKKSQKADEDFRTNEFWKFVDHELILARTTIAEDNPTDLAARAEQWNASMQGFFERDLREYAGKGQLTTPKSTGPTFDWQIFIEASTVWAF
ncbi:hypothetical protein C8Q76DRAFT_801965 [Earliella scabrosa]|nr:hypothetical protein C8Q76DRAFT_801965 [Earliella scabrosa]